MAMGSAETTPSPRLHAGWLALTLLVATYAGIYVVARSWRIVADHAWGSIPTTLIATCFFWWILGGCWHRARTRGSTARTS